MAKKSSGQQLLEELPAVETPTVTPEVAPVNDPPVETPVAETPPENTQNALDIPQVVSRETNPWLEKVKSLGFENIQNEDEARERLFQDYEATRQQMDRLRQEYEQAQYYARLGQQYATHMQDPAFANQMAQRQPAPAEEPKQDNWWNPPKFDLQLANRWRTVVLDEKEIGRAHV